MGVRSLGEFESTTSMHPKGLVRVVSPGLSRTWGIDSLKERLTAMRIDPDRQCGCREWSHPRENLQSDPSQQGHSMQL